MTTSNQTLPRVGWIGTGVMGGSMCSHLLHKGYPVVVNTRTKAKADGLVEHGATWADTPKAVSEQSDIVFTIVGFPADVREVYFGADGVLSAARAGQVFVDMTTTEPTLAKEIYEAARAHGADSVDAPVSGGDVGARNATLTIMIGGDQRDGRSADAAVRDDGQAGALSGRARRRPAHEDVQSDRDRGHDGRHVRGAALRAQGRTESRDDGRNDPRRRRRLLGARQPRAAHPQARLRAGFRRRALHQGHGHRARRSRPHEHRAARPGARAPALCRSCGRRATAAAARRR